MRPIRVGHLKPPRPDHLHRKSYVAHNSTFTELQRPPLSDVCHRFTAEECDRGFTRFSELRTLLQPQAGHNRPTIEGGSTVVSVYVRVLEDPTVVLWHNFVK